MRPFFIIMEDSSTENTLVDEWRSALSRVLTTDVPVRSYSPHALSEFYRAVTGSAERPILIVTGGDGSLNRGVRTLDAQNLLGKVDVLYHPSGTGNDFSRAVGLHGLNIGEVAALLKDGETFNIHLGRFNDEIFINVATFGCFAKVTPSVEKDSKSLLGAWSYYIKGLSMITELEPLSVTFRMDEGEEMRMDVFGFFVGNARYCGGGVQVAPGASPLSRRLQILLVPQMDVTTLFKLGIEMQKASPVFDEYPVVCKTIERLEFSASETLSITLDGENYSAKQGIVTNLGRTVRMFLPREPER